MPPPPPRPKFEPDVVSPTTGTTTSSPAHSSPSALARFEFEAGRGNEGTKILMVEWEEEEEEEEDSNDDKDGDKDDDNEEKKKRNPRADWHVSWEGKTTALLSARDGAEGEDRLHRIYFLLAPGTSVPPVVKLSRGSASTSPDTHNNTGNPNPNPNPPAPCTTTATTTTTTIEIKPLPAIFPPELGLRGTAAGRRGILHTRYAKQRLAVLRLEIEREMRTNGEGIGLEIAVQEKQWLEDNFGVGEYQKRDQDGDISNNNNPASSPSLKTTTPGGRLAERLRGLKLGTSREVLAGSASGENHPLSPSPTDLAISSFSLFHSTAPRRAIIAQNPPEHVLAQQQQSTTSTTTAAGGSARAGARIASLDELASGSTAIPIPIPPRENREEEDIGDELFAVKLSPRSPEMEKSPFSFSVVGGKS